MTGLILLALLNAQVSYIVTEGAVFMRLRIWAMARSYWMGYLFTCFVCFGTWVGIVEGLVAARYIHIFSSLLDPILLAFSIACAGRIIHAVIEAVGRIARGGQATLS